jgi:hypothetical protein
MGDVAQCGVLEWGSFRRARPDEIHRDPERRRGGKAPKQLGFGFWEGDKFFSAGELPADAPPLTLQSFPRGSFFSRFCPNTTDLSE